MDWAGYMQNIHFLKKGFSSLASVFCIYLLVVIFCFKENGDLMILFKIAVVITK